MSAEVSIVVAPNGAVIAANNSLYLEGDSYAFADGRVKWPAHNAMKPDGIRFTKH